jgi:hypothetical protein
MFLKFFTSQFNFFDRFEEQVDRVVEAVCFFQEVAAHAV